MTDKTGGPAFPNGIKPGKIFMGAYVTPDDTNEVWVDSGGSNGMTIRDYFAAKAMQAVIANAMCSEKEAVFYDEVSEISYEMADAMIKAR